MEWLAPHFPTLQDLAPAALICRRVRNAFREDQTLLDVFGSEKRITRHAFLPPLDAPTSGPDLRIAPVVITPEERPGHVRDAIAISFSTRFLWSRHVPEADDEAGIETLLDHYRTILWSPEHYHLPMTLPDVPSAFNLADEQEWTSTSLSYIPAQEGSMVLAVTCEIRYDVTLLAHPTTPGRKCIQNLIANGFYA